MLLINFQSSIKTVTTMISSHIAEQSIASIAYHDRNREMVTSSHTSQRISGSSQNVISTSQGNNLHKGGAVNSQRSHSNSQASQINGSRNSINSQRSPSTTARNLSNIMDANNKKVVNVNSRKPGDDNFSSSVLQTVFALVNI